MQMFICIGFAYLSSEMVSFQSFFRREIIFLRKSVPEEAGLRRIKVIENACRDNTESCPEQFLFGIFLWRDVCG